MEMAVIGTGYVGLVSGVCFAEAGNTVVCVDRDETKIALLQRAKSPIFEPGIEAYMARNMEAGRLAFTSDVAAAVRGSDMIVIAVGTPSLSNGEADLRFIREVAEAVGQAMNGRKIVAVKSTVPVGTNETVRRIIAEQTDEPFDVVSIPEFLREGSAIQDTLHPDRIVIGLDNRELEPTLVGLHRAFTDRIYVTDVRSAEMIKYASNAFLATKISFINEISNICEKVGADVTQVAAGMGMDTRIGPSFLNAGIGYGGSCFPKDTKALIQLAGNVDYEFKLLKSVVEVNADQRYKIIAKLEQALGHVQNAVIGIWGLSFKANTDDIRDSPAFDIAQTLLRRGARLKLYDPVAMEKMKEKLDHPFIQWCESAMEAAASADAVCLLTDWQEFKDVDLRLLIYVMNQPIVVDGRNIFAAEQVAMANVRYYAVGRPNLQASDRAEAPAV
ncbi:UDP-glucose dehydrogenase family protein [Paenibacillus cymbidii]|uniref:UDP-glucose dehydrogenase family protein n=1 Tax=Paenibacillus cymbidii TaxID=1639034 RepID=UPI0010801AD8|nr:UDP-glucose/GDP-mannose dehydrogenase family protein [Paenibacillus cymbidii]